MLNRRDFRERVLSIFPRWKSWLQALIFTAGESWGEKDSCTKIVNDGSKEVEGEGMGIKFYINHYFPFQN